MLGFIVRSIPGILLFAISTAIALVSTTPEQMAENWPKWLALVRRMIQVMPPELVGAISSVGGQITLFLISVVVIAACNSPLFRRRLIGRGLGRGQVVDRTSWQGRQEEPQTPPIRVGRDSVVSINQSGGVTAKEFHQHGPQPRTLRDRDWTNTVARLQQYDGTRIRVCVLPGVWDSAEYRQDFLLLLQACHMKR